MPTCAKCKCVFEPNEMRGEKCLGCAEKERFAAFAKECGLEWFPDPSGERYLHSTSGGSRKKSERPGTIDELWNALVKARGGGDLLIPGN